MDYADRMVAIMIADHERWLARVNEDSKMSESRATIAHATNDRRYMRGIGLIPQNESNRDYPNMPARMAYTDTEKCEGTSPNVRIYRADGSVSVKPSSSFRSRGIATRVRVVRETRTRIKAQDLGGSQGDYD
jgi:hypothetical protein